VVCRNREVVKMKKNRISSLGIESFS